MVNFGFPLVSTTFSRTTQNLSRDVIMGNVRRLQEGLILLEEQLSSGIRLLRPSIDPIATTRVLDYDNRIAKNTRFLASVERVSGRLDRADVVAEDAITVAGKARDILLEQVQGTATTQTRLIAANQVNELLRQTTDMANTRFEGRYLFGGTQTSRPPVTTVGGAVVYQANVFESYFHAAERLAVRENVHADEVFGVLSDEIRGLQLPQQTVIDLNPDLTAATRIEDLFRGQGVPLGEITVSSTGTATIDLGPAKTVGNLVTLINTQTPTTGVTAAIDPTGTRIRLTSAGLITVADVAGGVTASRLGIAVTGAASPVDGNDLDAAVTERTLFSQLVSGAGLSPAGIRITNAYAGQVFSATIATPATMTVGAFLEAINTGSGSGAFVFARINDERTGINLFSRMSGGRMRIVENGGTTASSLGLLYSPARAKLVDLTGGLGLGTVEGVDIRITRKDGVQLTLDVDRSTTVQDLVAQLDGLPGISAALNAAGALVVTDLTAGVGPLEIEDINGSFAAANLGVAQATAGVSISGTALVGAGVQVEGLFTALIRLRDALLADDTDLISNARRLVELGEQRAVSGRASVGARGEALQFTRNRLELENDELARVRSIDKDLDLAEAASQFQAQTAVLQAALLVASRIMQVSLLNYL